MVICALAGQVGRVQIYGRLKLDGSHNSDPNLAAGFPLPPQNANVLPVTQTNMLYRVIP